MKQAKEIIWANGRIQRFMGSNSHKYLAKAPNNSEMRVNFKNGSFIKVDGSENYEAYRGITPHIIIYDEFKDFRPEFHVGMEPNLAAKEAPIIIAGTPPEKDQTQYTILADQFRRDPNGAWFNFPSEANPHLSKEWLAHTKVQLYERGEGDVWEREYMARRVRGGINSIFPMFNPKELIVPHETLMEEIKRDRHKLQWLCIADPGNVTVFGVLFGCFNPYTKLLIWLDELYVTEQSETSVTKMIPAIREIKEDLFPRRSGDADWINCADEAAAWFMTEATASFDENFFPTQKSHNKKDEGLSLIKDQMLSSMVRISSRCKNLAWEVENYIRDKNGKIPKENDHLIDCWRYGNAAAGLSLAKDFEPEEKKPDWRGFTPEWDARQEESDNFIETYMPYEDF